MFMPGKMINHTSLVGAFDKYYDIDELQLVTFNKHGTQKHLNKGHCRERTDRRIKKTLRNLQWRTKQDNTKGWSDQNHFTTV